MSDRALLPGEYVVLALLGLRPMHGYEMACVLEDEGLGAVCPIEQGTLYTYIRNVEARGLVDWVEERHGARPPRKTYRLTASGREVTDTWLRQPVERMREVRLEFLIKLYFLEKQDPEAHRRLLSEQIQVCEGYLSGLAARPQSDGFEALVLRSKRSAAEATLNWLKQYAYELESNRTLTAP